MRLEDAALLEGQSTAVTAMRPVVLVDDLVLAEVLLRLEGLLAGLHRTAVRPPVGVHGQFVAAEVAGGFEGARTAAAGKTALLGVHPLVLAHLRGQLEGHRTAGHWTRVPAHLGVHSLVIVQVAPLLEGLSAGRTPVALPLRPVPALGDAVRLPVLLQVGDRLEVLAADGAPEVSRGGVRRLVRVEVAGVGKGLAALLAPVNAHAVVHRLVLAQRTGCLEGLRAEGALVLPLGAVVHLDVPFQLGGPLKGLLTMLAFVLEDD